MNKLMRIFGIVLAAVCTQTVVLLLINLNPFESIMNYAISFAIAAVIVSFYVKVTEKK